MRELKKIKNCLDFWGGILQETILKDLLLEMR